MKSRTIHLPWAVILIAALSTACTHDPELGSWTGAVESGDQDAGPADPDAGTCGDCEDKRCECLDLQGRVEEIRVDIAVAIHNEQTARSIAENWGRVWQSAIDAQQAVLDGTFGPDDRVKAAAISIDLVLDAMVVGNIYKITKCGIEGGINYCKYAGAVRKSVEKKLLREVVVKSAEASLNRAADAICDIADTGGWEARHLIPFMSAVDTYFECTTADDKIEALGLEAQRAMLMKQRWLDTAEAYADEREQLLDELEDAVAAEAACWEELAEMTCCPCDDPESGDP